MVSKVERPTPGRRGRSALSGGVLTALAGALIMVLVLLGGVASAPFADTVHLGGTTAIAIPGVARTPPMGWNSWNAYGCSVDERTVEQTADAMVASGMRTAGYRYVVVDDCWFATQRASSGALQPDPTRFPHGIAALAAYVHARGLKFGIYESPNSRTCAQISGTYPGSTGSSGHEMLDARTFASWGVDYLKYDWCSPDSNIDRQVSAFTTMRDALRATGRPIVYSINPNSDVPGAPPGGIYDWSGIGTLWRTTNDLLPGWALRQGAAGNQGVSEILSGAAASAARSGPGHWADPDMLEVGVPGVQGTSYPGLTTVEQRTQFGMWALLAAPLMAGNALPYMNETTWRLLTDPEIIAVDQDPLAAPVAVVPGTDGKVWRRTLSDGSVAVALWNSGDATATLSIALPNLNLPAANSYTARNLWSGAHALVRTRVGAQVAAHDTVLLRITPSRVT
ncbi:glycoside hydrolase family 27 protein [Nocardia macrotermitis]|uniref:Alpha-galactosidase n=1 Tax=Nocardia macrotermitis TaxID=2585198 RepID=A0A7K0D2F4_9NOCA|nr:glycoside hydrolase family 27 protein [Nocardia macrotermitis]MQY19899.1 Alpha-galactosidase A [Nocardia macrotermitis]